MNCGRDSPTSVAPVTIEGRRYVAILQQWNRGRTGEGLYGWAGSSSKHRTWLMTYNGEERGLATQSRLGVPFLWSRRAITAILWDNVRFTRDFGNPALMVSLSKPSSRYRDGGGGGGRRVRVSRSARLASPSCPACPLHASTIYISITHHWPAEVGTSAAPGLRVVWTWSTSRRASPPCTLPALRLLPISSSGRRELVLAAGVRTGNPCNQQFRPSD